MMNVAQIINTHALKGECKLWLYTDMPEIRFKKGSRLFLEDGKALTVRSFRTQKGFGYAFFEGIDSIEKAERLKGQMLHAGALEDDLEEDEFYYHQLLDCQVVNEQEEILGTVSDILETGANLVLRVKNDTGNFLIPFTKNIVQHVDPVKKTIVITEMEGLR